MFRVNSTSKQLVRLNVIEAGRPQLVDLLPKNFVFTDIVTDQMRQLEKIGAIRVRETKVVKANAAKTQAQPVVTEQPSMEGKLDFVQETAVQDVVEDEASKVAKVQKKKK